MGLKIISQIQVRACLHLFDGEGMCTHKLSIANNPLVSAGLIQQAHLSDILSTPEETPSTKHRGITETQLMTADEYHKTMEEKNREASG